MENNKTDSKEVLHTHEWHESKNGNLTLARTMGRPCFVKVFGKTEKEATQNNNDLLKLVNNYQTLLDSNRELVEALLLAEKDLKEWIFNSADTFKDGERRLATDETFQKVKSALDRNVAPEKR